MSSGRFAKTKFFHSDGKISKVVRIDDYGDTTCLLYYRYTNDKITEIIDSSNKHYPKYQYLTWSGNKITHVKRIFPWRDSGSEFYEEEIALNQTDAKNPLYMPMGVTQEVITELAFGEGNGDAWTTWCENIVYPEAEVNIDFTLNSDGYPTEAKLGQYTHFTYTYAD